MPIEIDREQVLSLQAGGAQVVEVLSAKQYREVHIAGAQNLPLAGLNKAGAARLDRARPVIVYCYDFR